MKLIGIGANNPETLRMVAAISKIAPDFSFIGFIDNDIAKQKQCFFGIPVLGGHEAIPSLTAPDVRFVNLITRDCVTRYETSLKAAELGAVFCNFVHPDVNLEMVDMGVGNYIQEGVILQACVEIGCNSSIHMGSLIGHETRIGHSVFIAHGCNVSGCVQINDGVLMGAGVTLHPRISIGEWSVISAGATVRKNVPPCSLVAGNPAKILKCLRVPYSSGNPFRLFGRE